MAGEISGEATSSSQVTNESLEATIEINVKTLDSQIFSFRVNKNMPVPLLKEKIANAVGVPVGLQRLIFRGRVLKDDHLLSDYYVEDGHTLHLVARQPLQTQGQTGTSSGETAGHNGSDSAAGAPRNRVGQVSHSVVLGSFNVADQTEVIAPDLSHIVGAVLNSLGIGTPTTTGGAGNASSINAPNASSPVSQSVEVDTTQDAGGRSQTGNRLPFPPSLFPLQYLNQSQQFPLPGMLSHHMAIPDSLTTLSVFISSLEQELLLNGYQPSATSNSQDSSRSNILPSNSFGLPTPEVLGTVVERARQLLIGRAATALSHIAGRLGTEGSSTDPVVRGQIQTQAMHIGVAVQHLGALLLELGRTILMLRMGQSPTEAVVNSGPAVYISASGPNPMMVQPVLHTSPLFGISSTSPFTSAGVPGPGSIGDAHRNINIHIHSGTPIVAGGSVGSRTNAGDGTHGERSDQGPTIVNRNGLGASGPMRGLPSRTFVAAIPARSPAEASSHVLNVVYPIHVRPQQSNSSHSVSAQLSGPIADNGPQNNEGSAASLPPSESESIPTIVAQINAQIANALAGNAHGQNSSAPSLLSTDALCTRVGAQPVTSGSSSLSDFDKDDPSRLPEIMAVEGANGTGIDSLLPRVSENSIRGSEMEQIKPDDLKSSNNKDAIESLSRQETSTTSSIRDSPSCSDKDSTVDSSIHISGSRQSKQLPEGDNPVPLGLGLQSLQPKRRSKQSKSREGPPGGHDLQSIARGQQVLQSLVSKSSDTSQTNDGGRAGVCPPSGLGRTQVVEGQSPDLGGMHLGSGRGQVGFDISRIFQQMVPVLSQAWGTGSGHPVSSHSVELEPQPPCNDLGTGRDHMLNDKNSQIDLHQVVEGIEHQDSPGKVFRTMLECARGLFGEGNSFIDLVEELGNDEELANEFLEMFRRWICKQVQPDSGSTDES